MCRLGELEIDYHVLVLQQRQVAWVGAPHLLAVQRALQAGKYKSKAACWKRWMPHIIVYEAQHGTCSGRLAQ